MAAEQTSTNMMRETLVKIAMRLVVRSECLLLGAKLNLPDSALAVIESCREIHYSSEDALTMLLVWWHRQESTVTAGKVLYDALLNIDRHDIATTFKTALIPLELECPASKGCVLPMKVLADIGKGLTTKDCVFLAVELEIDDDEVSRIKDGPHTRQLGFDVLCRWQDLKGAKAMGRVLFDALVATGKKALAECIPKHLM